MNKLSLCTIVFSLMLVTSAPAAHALSDSELQDCLKKMPKDLTNAEKTVYKKKCNSKERQFGQVPTNVSTIQTPRLIYECVMYKSAQLNFKSPQPPEIKKFLNEFETKHGETLEVCKQLYKDKIWNVGKKMTNEKAVKIYDYYTKSIRP